MEVVHLSLLRGVCQMPGYVAAAKGFFQQQGLNVQLTVEPTAWAVPDRLLRGQVQFAVMPWTRVAAASAKGEPLVLICGSGCEEAAIVVRKGLRPEDVKKVAIPQRGGMKDLTAMGLMQTLGWGGVEWVRLPSGDGAILSLVGQGADAASMVEPYATMLQELQIGTVVKRTGDLWPGAPGCSLATTTELIDGSPDVVQRMVNAYVAAAEYVEKYPEDSAAIAAQHIGIAPRFIRGSLRCCRPNLRALDNQEAMGKIIALMLQLGYISQRPRHRYYNDAFLDRAVEGSRPTGALALPDAVHEAG